MSREDVEVVRRFVAPYDGMDAVPLLRELVETAGPEFNPDAVLAYWAQDPSFRHVHPDIEWDVPRVGTGVPAHGPTEVALWFVEWLAIWERLVYRVVECRDLGDWVLVTSDSEASGRDGITVKRRIFQLFQIREGKIALLRTLGSERAALASVGLTE